MVCLKSSQAQEKQSKRLQLFLSGIIGKEHVLDTSLMYFLGLAFSRERLKSFSFDLLCRLIPFVDDPKVS